MSAGHQALLRLLAKGERARSRNADEQVSLSLTAASCPEYAALDSLQAFESFHADIQLARRAGAIDVEQLPARGDAARLKRLKLRALDELAAHLGVQLRSDRVAEASRALAHWQEAYPVVAHILDAWAHGRPVRGSGTEATTLLVDAIAAFESRRPDQREERILRRESVRLYGDSKRLERLTPWLDVLANGEIKPSGLRPEDIWAQLGLRREPQPMLLSGTGFVQLSDTTIPLVRPYLGLPVGAVEGIVSQARYVMTIENLASFHDAARAMPDMDGLLIYTAGMPSPAWRALYGKILRGLPAETEIYHWGDVDMGGFRIAALLSAVVNETGRTLLPWLMSPVAIGMQLAYTATPAAVVLAEMVRWAERAGWIDVANDLRLCPMQVEQESLDPQFPRKKTGR